MVEVVLPAVLGGVRERRGLSARLTDDVPHSQYTRAPAVWPTVAQIGQPVGRRADRELLGRTWRR